MREDPRFTTAVPNALDHRRVIELVRQDRASRHPRRQRADRRHVRDIARSEKKCGFLAVQIGQFALQQHVIVIGACDIACPARAGTAAIERLMHCCEHRGMLAHAEVIIGAPHRYFAGAAPVTMLGARERARLTLQICKYAIPALAMKAFELPAEMSLVVHDVLLLSIATGARRDPPSGTRILFSHQFQPGKRGRSHRAQTVMVVSRRHHHY